MAENKKRSILGELFFRMARAYVGFWHNCFYYKHIHQIGKENVPAKGTPLIIASNHQNAVNDALAVEFSFMDRPVSIFTRADLFSKPVLGSVLRAWHLLPAFRLGMDGIDSLDKNFDVFKEAGETILDGGSVMIFPEAVNQDKRWLGEFSQGYLRMAFDAAKRDNFETDIQILPMANHYSDYFHFREELLVRFGKPISLKPYYELFQTKPRTVQRKVNAEVRSQISEMMLNITDLDNYEAIDFVRNTFGGWYCRSCNGDSSLLPDRLEADKAMFSELQQARENGMQDAVDEIYADALALKKGCVDNNVSVSVFSDGCKPAGVAMWSAALLAGLPLFVVSLVPNILFYLLPKPVVNKLKSGTSHAAMFIGGVRFALNVIVTIPVFYTAFFVALGCLAGWVYAAVHTLCLPFLAVFAWEYRKKFLWVKNKIRFRRLKEGALKPFVGLYNKILNKLDNILTKNTWKKE